MDKYTGTKTIKAKPMRLGPYNELRGWGIPDDEDPTKRGYLVGYPDAQGNFDGPLQDGCHHISWSPKDVFEAAYFTDKGKTLHNSDVSRAKKNVPDIVTFGNGDMFRLLSKASSKKEGWMKSTKAMDVGHGCVVQVTTQQGDNVAEAVCFVPGVTIYEARDGHGVIALRSLGPIVNTGGN